MIIEAERRFPVRIRLALPTGGLGERLDQMQTWLDQNAGTDGWAMTPSGIRTVINDVGCRLLRRRDDRERVCGAMVRRA